MKSFVTIVTGVPRSGTSMTMRMLEFGGIPIHANHPTGIQGTSFNKYGCYESGNINPDLRVYEGKALKVLNPVLLFGAPEFKYKVIVPIRDNRQILLSRMQAFKGNHGREGEDIRILGALGLIRHILSIRKDMDILEIHYNDYFDNTLDVTKKMQEFLGFEFDYAKATNAVDPSLFKIRS